jgi:hypothetical protein
MQTLTTLNIRWNNIDAKGIQHLAHALQGNTVRQLVSFSISDQLLLINTDTYDIRSLREQYRC